MTKILALARLRPLRYKFLSSSTLLLASAMTVNLFNYLFQVASARLLSVNNYGILQTALSILNLLTVGTVIINLQITKELTKMIKRGKAGEAAFLAKKTSYLVLTIGSMLLLLFLAGSQGVSLHIGLLQPWHLLVVGVLAILSFLLATTRSVMRANLEFLQLAVNANIQVILRLTIVITLLLLGLRLEGAMGGMVAAFLVAYVVSIWQTRKALRRPPSDTISVNSRTFTRESISTTLGFLGLASLVSTDLLLVQKFLPEQAGLYAGLTLFGKIIIFATTPITSALFPLMIHAKGRSEERGLLNFSLILVIVLSGVVLLSYLFFGNTIVSFILSRTYLPIAPLLAIYGLFALIYSVIYLVVHGFIALNKFAPAYLTFLFAIMQAGGIWFLHRSLGEVVTVSLITITLLALLTFVYAFYKATLKRTF